MKITETVLSSVIPTQKTKTRTKSMDEKTERSIVHALVSCSSLNRLEIQKTLKTAGLEISTSAIWFRISAYTGAYAKTDTETNNKVKGSSFFPYYHVDGKPLQTYIMDAVQGNWSNGQKKVLKDRYDIEVE